MSRWLVACGTAGVAATFAGLAVVVVREGLPSAGMGGELVLRLAMTCAVIGAALSPVEGLAAIARRLGGRRRVALVGLVSLMPALSFLVAIVAGLWLDAMGRNPDPAEALEAAASTLQGVGGGGFLSWEDVARFVGVLTALLLPIGVARAWDAGPLRTAGAAALGGLLAVGSVKLVVALEGTGAPGPEAKALLMALAVSAAGGAGLWLGDRLEERLAGAASRHLLGRED